MWSFGCIMAEMFMGYPLFPGENEQEQMQMFMEQLGVPPQGLLEVVISWFFIVDPLKKCQRRKVFFNDNKPYTPLLPPNSRGKVRVPKSKELNYYLNCSDENFVDFVKKCFTWNMEDRMKPAEVMNHHYDNEIGTSS